MVDNYTHQKYVQSHVTILFTSGIVKSKYLLQKVRNKYENGIYMKSKAIQHNSFTVIVRVLRKRLDLNNLLSATRLQRVFSYFSF